MRFLVLFLLFAVSTSAQFLGRFYVDSTLVPVGKEDATVRIFTLPPDNLIVRWNGQDRAVERQQGSGSTFVRLLPEDTAHSCLGELTIVDSATGSILATAWIPVGFTVLVGDAVYDKARHRVYVTTPQQPGDPRFPAESLVAMDPDSGEILRTVNLAGLPRKIALTNDGSTLYVVLESGGVVKRLDAETLTVSSEFRFRPAVAEGRGGGSSTVGIAVLPGTQSTIGLYFAPNLGASGHTLSIFDNGTKRAIDVDMSGGYDSLMFSPDGNYLFVGAVPNFNSPQRVLRYNVAATGFPDRNAESALGGGPVDFVGDLLYTSRGTAINYKTMAMQRAIGVGGAIAVDSERSRILAVYFLSSRNVGDYPQYLQAFDLDTSTPLGWLNFGNIYYLSAGASPVQRLLRFGTDGLIFTSSRGLLMFRTPLAGPAPELGADGVRNSLGQVVTALRPGETLTLSGDNLGPEIGVEASEATVSLGGVRVWFNGVAGNLTSVSKNEIKVQVPTTGLPTTSGSIVRLQVWYLGIPSRRLTFEVAK